MARSRPILLALLAVLALALVAVLTSACDEDGNDDELERLVFMAGFTPQANLAFVSVYVADAQGFFADEGLEVDIQHSGQGQHLQALLGGEVDVTTGTAAQDLLRRADGVPVRAVALFGQRGDQGFVVRADSGIEEPADFRGHSVGFKGGVVPAELVALLATAGLTEDDVDLQGVGYDPRIFIEGQVDVFPVFLNNEPDTITRAGVDIRVFDPADYGVATLGVTYLVREEMAEQQPELVERFLRATLRGAAWAQDHIDEAVDIALVYAEGADPEHQRFLLEQDLKSAQRDDGIGRGTLDQWESLQQVLLEFDPRYAGPIDVADAFDPSFTDGLYNDDGTLK